MSVVIYEKKGRIAYITLNRPERMNAINGELIREMDSTWKDFKNDDNLWVAILTGAGKAFCSGVDAQALSDPEIHAFEKGPYENPNSHMVFKPIIAAVNGYALGRGNGLALSCDIRIASEAAQFGVLEARFGWVAPVGNLPTLTSDGIVREMVYTASTITAQRACEVGIVNKVVPPDQLLSEATAMAEKICENNPLAVWGTKELLLRGKGLDEKAYRALSQEINERVTKSEDFAEGQKALREKRKAEYKGR